MLGASLSVQAQSVPNMERETRSSRVERKSDKKKDAKRPTVKVPYKQLEKMEQQMALSPVRRMEAQEIDPQDVILLDSVIGDGYSKYYDYNEQGWLVSAKVYEWDEDALLLDTEESFLLEYDFDGQGRCTRYSYFLYNDDATKGQEIERVEVEWTSGSYTCIERYYVLCREGVDELDLMAEVKYDKYGNICMIKTYSLDEESGAMVLEDCEEMKFTAYVMEKDEDGDLDFDDDLFEKHCYYYVGYGTIDRDDEQYKYIEGFKVDSKTEGNTITRSRYEIDLNEEYGDVVDFDQLDSYWELGEATVMTLTPSGTRFESICLYEGYEEDYEEDYPQEELPTVTDKPVATRAADDWVLVYRWDFEWDEYERLAKIVYTDCEDNEVEETYTCTYYDNKYKTITLDDLLNAWICYWEDLDSDSGYYLIQAGFYGKAHEERMDWEDGYAERINVEYDNNGRVTHYTEAEVYYSEEELGGVDLDGDGEVSTECEVYNSETWITYDAEGNILESITYEDYNEANRAYKKQVYVNELIDGRYMMGEYSYDGASKEGPWTLVGEDIYIYEDDPATNPDVQAVEGWYRYYEYDFGTWYGSKWEITNGEYYSVSVDPETGEFPTVSYAPATRSEELQEGDNEIYFVEDGWVYEGYKYVEYVLDKATETYVLKVTDGEMRISRGDKSKGFYAAGNPANNYEFPVGPYFWMTEYEDVQSDVNWLEFIVWWDMEQEKWMTDEDHFYRIQTHYTAENGKIINKEDIYGFDIESERMRKEGSQIYSVYSFDEQDRVSTIEVENSYTLYYVYLNDECDYLLESYMVDKATNEKYNVCKYYYHNGKYTGPETEIEAVESQSTWSIEGNIVIAEGTISLYNLNGQLVARGHGTMAIEQSGLYIIEVNGQQVKLWIK